MAHELHIQNGKASMAFIGETPWHGLGQAMTKESTMDEWAIAANMNFTLERTPVQYNVGNTLSSFPEKHVLYRSDTQTPLAVVSNKYKIVQPREVLDFYTELTDKLGYQMATAGVLFGGKRYWALASAGETASIGNDSLVIAGKTIKGDQYGRYLLFSTACDGTMATRIMDTTIRVVCNNTLQIATNRNANGLSIPHSREFNADDVKKELGLGDSFTHFMEDMRKFADRTLSKQESINYLINLIGNPNETIENQAGGDARVMQEIYELYDNKSMGNHFVSANGTLLGMLNAVTEYTDHHTNHKTGDARVNAAWFGNTAQIKNRAYEQATSLVDA
jgi:phage/plasmid-like protein (TIGR03299 family)